MSTLIYAGTSSPLQGNLKANFFHASFNTSPSFYVGEYNECLFALDQIIQYQKEKFLPYSDSSNMAEFVEEMKKQKDAYPFNQFAITQLFARDEDLVQLFVTNIKINPKNNIF